MHTWPKSLPEYKWPANLMSPGLAIVRAAMAGVFHAARAIGLLFSLIDRHHRDNRVLVIRTDGLGDGLLFEPALESLARTFSPREIHLWAPRLTCDLLAHCPTISQFRAIPRGFKDGNLKYFRSFFWRAKLGFLLGRWTFDKALYLAESPEPLGNWLLLSTCASERWLNYGDTINQFESQRSWMHDQANLIIENRPGNVHELLRNEYLASQWCEDKTLRQPKLYLTERVKARAETQLRAWQAEVRRMGGQEIVGIVPGASLPTVNSYPATRWATVLRRLWDEHRMVPALLGGPDDRATLDRLAEELRGIPHLRLPKPLGVLDSAILVGKLDGVLSVDTGLAHLAVAQQVPTVVLVAGGNPGRFFPWPNARHHIALNNSTPCSGCNNRCTEIEPICITHITPDEIVAAYLQLKGRRVSVEVHISANPRQPLQAAG